MKKTVIYIMSGLFFLLTLIFIVWFNANKPRILVLQSYDSSYPWTRDVDVGLKRVLKNRPYAMKWFYMDTKRHTSADFKAKAGIAARRMIDDWRPDILIAIDDDAQRYVTTKYLDHPRIRIIFAGINGEIEPYGFDKARNATGIIERKRLAALKICLLTAAKRYGINRPLRIMDMGDDSQSVKEDEKIFRAFDWAPIELVDSHLVGTFDEWKSVISEADKVADFIITENYRKLKRNKDSKELVPPKEVVAWTEKNSKIPVIGTNGFFVEDGGMLAIATSPYEQGEVAAGMALEIIEKGKKTTEIPVASPKQFVVYMRESVMKSRGFLLPDIYESFARATNNYFE